MTIRLVFADISAGFTSNQTILRHLNFFSGSFSDIYYNSPVQLPFDTGR
jgi:hypothetical protein